MKTAIEKCWHILLSLFITLFLIIYFFRTSSLSMPFNYGGDASLSSLLIKSIVDKGWYLHNSMIGAPYGLDMNDFAMSDGFNMLIIKLLALFTSNYAIVMNLFYLLCYFLTAATSAYVLKKLNVSPLYSVMGSVLFTFMPYHFLRSERHLFLSSYYMIPLIVLVVFWIWENQWNKKRLVAASIVALVVSSTGIYYAFFACLFMIVATIYVLVGSKKIRSLIVPVCLVGMIVFGGLINVAPTILYQIQHGKNLEVGKRSPIESELYGLKIMNLFMPIESHRLAKIAETAKEYNTNTPLINENKLASLGIIGSLGFISLIILLFSRVKDQTILRISHMNLFALLLSTIGGFGSLFANLISPEIRAYNRISIFIAFFAIFAVCYLLDKHVKIKPSYTYILLFFLLAFGLWDQTGRSLNPQTDHVKSIFLSDDRYFKQIESSVPKDTMVFQLPYVPFPENPPVVKMNDYDHLRGYLHTSDIRWSYGAMRGREQDMWNRSVSVEPVGKMVQDIASKGFRGIYINRTGYDDNGAAIETQLQSVLQLKPFENEDHTLAFYSIVK